MPDFLKLENTVASINIIRKKVAKLLFILSIIISIVFIIFYLGVIYLKKELVPTIIYSLFILITLSSSIVDILFFSNNKKVINIIQKRKNRKKRRIKTNTIFIVKTIVKLVSIGYGIYLLVGDFTTINIILVTVPSVLLFLQLLLVFLASIFIGYSEYIIIGVEQDLIESKLINIVGSKSLKANLITTQLLYNDSQEKLIHEIDIQKLKDKDNSHENYKLTKRMVIYNECKTKAYKLLTIKYPTNSKKNIQRKIKNLLNKLNNIYLSKYKNEEEFNKIIKIIDYLNENIKDITNDKYLSLVSLLLYFVYGISKLEIEYDLDLVIINLSIKESEFKI